MGSSANALETKLNRLGRDADKQSGFLNCPVYRGSTTIFKCYEDIEKRRVRYYYGTAGNPTISNLEDAWTSLTGSAGTVVTPSGLAAVSLALLTVVKCGDTILMVDSAYLPTREFCDEYLAKMGVKTVYYDPLISAQQLKDMLMNDKTVSLIFLESPGSQTFEVQDVPALAEVARDSGIASILDNTWGTPLFFDAFKHGCDISLEAGTKYLGGHSDLLLGLVAANEEWFPRLRRTYDLFAQVPGNEDCFLALRGMRTMHIRLKEAEKRAFEIAHWLKTRDEVLSVLHPALPECPGHHIWKRDYAGSSGLFSFVLKPQFSKEDACKMLDNMNIFAMGYSWGGFESLIMMYDCSTYRTARIFSPGGMLIRLQIGLECIEDLKKDLLDGFARLKL